MWPRIVVLYSLKMILNKINILSSTDSMLYTQKRKQVKI